MSEVANRNVVMACLGIPAPDGSKQGPGHRCWLCTLQKSTLLLETRHGVKKAVHCWVSVQCVSMTCFGNREVPLAAPVYIYL